MIQEAQDLAIATLANCEAFQLLVGRPDAARAKQRIFSDVLPVPEGAEWTADELDAIRPFALVHTTEDITGFVYERIATGCWNASGRITIKIERSLRDSDTAAQADARFKREVAEIIKQFAAQRETGDRLMSRRFNVEGPYRIAHEDLEEQGDHQWMMIYVEWGLE